MTKLDEKALEAAREARQDALARCDATMCQSGHIEAAIAAYIAALPIPEDVAGLVERLRETARNCVGATGIRAAGMPILRQEATEAADAIVRMALERDAALATGSAERIIGEAALVARAEKAEASLADLQVQVEEKDKALEMIEHAIEAGFVETNSDRNRIKLAADWRVEDGWLLGETADTIRNIYREFQSIARHARGKQA